MAVVSKKRVGDYVFYAILTLFMIILIVVTVYPFLNALALPWITPRTRCGAASPSIPESSPWKTTSAS